MVAMVMVMPMVMVMVAGFGPLLPALSSRIARSAASIGIAKPMPAAFARIAVLTPITWRRENQIPNEEPMPAAHHVATSRRSRADLASISADLAEFVE